MSNEAKELMYWQNTVAAQELQITALLERQELLEKTFRHTHVNNPYTLNDSCKECGLDLRDTGIHKLWREL